MALLTVICILDHLIPISSEIGYVSLEVIFNPLIPRVRDYLCLL